MGVHVIERVQVVPQPVEDVFAFFSLARNLEKLTPSWLKFEVLTPEPIAMRTGTTIDYRLRLHGVPLRWTSLIEEWEPGRRFVDRQIRGPYALWHHTHEFAPHPEGTLVRDRVRYAVHLGAAGEIARALFVRRDLNRVFAFRRRAVSQLLPALPVSAGA